MNINTFDLNLLRVFAAMHSERNVSRAAHLLNLSQPAMSNALMRLRRACNDPLFVRTSEGMVPTALAETLAEPVKQAMGILQASLGRPLEFDPLTSTRTFRLLTSDLGEMAVLPRLTRALAALAPKVKIVARQVAHTDYSRMLESGEADLAIGNLTFLKSGYYQQGLFTDRYVCVVRDRHPILRQALSFDAYLSASHIGVSSGSTDTLVDAVMVRRRTRREISLQVTHYHVATAVAASTDLIATLPEHVIEGANNIQTLELPFEMPIAEVRQFWHNRFHYDPGNIWLRAQIANSFLSETSVTLQP